MHLDLVEIEKDILPSVSFPPLKENEISSFEERPEDHRELEHLTTSSRFSKISVQTITRSLEIKKSQHKI